MTDHRTGTRDEWLDERLELLKLEKEVTHRNDEVARRRRELPWVRIDKDYVFDTTDGEATLADLFRGRHWRTHRSSPPTFRSKLPA
jgi:predicted dithiol-disulfide oxidoreductase (DUF899 family)